MKRWAIIPVAATVAAMSLPIGTAVASEGTGVYARWSYNDVTKTGRVSFGSEYPSATFSIDGARVPEEVSLGRTDFLNARTPFGRAYGSSEGSRYLLQRHTSEGGPWRTTYTFDAPMPANSWGIALGDLDADNIHIAAFDAQGVRHSIADWFQSSFNFCVGAVRPSGCSVHKRGRSVPEWNGRNALIRVGDETEGASAWLRPTWDVTTLVITWSAPDWDNSSYRIWFAADARPSK